MRSMASSGRLSNEAVLSVAEPTRTPSISSSTWRDSRPRMKMLDGLPRPPLLVNCSPGVCDSTSTSERPSLRSSAARSRTVTSAINDKTFWGVRVAVTTTSWASAAPGAGIEAVAVPCACSVGAARVNAHAAAQARRYGPLSSRIVFTEPRYAARPVQPLPFQAGIEAEVGWMRTRWRRKAAKVSGPRRPPQRQNPRSRPVSGLANVRRPCRATESLRRLPRSLHPVAAVAACSSPTVAGAVPA